MQLQAGAPSDPLRRGFVVADLRPESRRNRILVKGIRGGVFLRGEDVPEAFANACVPWVIF